MGILYKGDRKYGKVSDQDLGFVKFPLDSEPIVQDPLDSLDPPGDSSAGQEVQEATPSSNDDCTQDANCATNPRTSGDQSPTPTLNSPSPSTTHNF